MSKQFINEISRMKDLFDYKRGVVISEQKFLNEAEIPSAFKVPVTYEWADCIIKTATPNEKIEKGETNVVKNFEDGTRFNFNKDGSWMFIEKGAAASVYKMTGRWSCNQPPKPLGFTITANDGNQYYSETNKWLVSPNAGAAATTKKATQWIAEPATLDDDKNTLKKQMTGEKVKQLQTGLDIKGRGGKSLVTGKFWTLTDAKLKELYPNEYTTQKGVTKTLFDKIVTPTLKAPTAQVTAVPLAAATPAAGTTPVAGAAPALVTPNIPNLQTVQAKTAEAQTPDQIYKILYDGGMVQGDPEEGGKIRIDVKALNDAQKEKLKQYMPTLGYKYYRTRNKDGKFVFTKI